MKVNRVQSLDELLDARNFDGVCDMGDDVQRPKCTAKSEILRVIQAIDGKTFAMELCGEHDRELLRTLAAAPETGGIRFQETFKTADEAKALLEKHETKGDA